MCHYCHLTNKERTIASALFRLGYSFSFIAKLFGRSKSTLSREFRRNRNPHTLVYDPDAAQKKYERCRKKCRHPKILPSHPALFLEIKDKFLNHQWSPEQIVGRINKKEFPASVTGPYTEPFTLIFLTNQELNAWPLENCVIVENTDIRKDMMRNGVNSK